MNKPLTRQQAWRIHNPRRYLAHLYVEAAKRCGVLAPQPCEICGAAKAEAHHDDYDRPGKVRWLCRKHHVRLHKGKLSDKSLENIEVDQSTDITTDQSADNPSLSNIRENKPSDNHKVNHQVKPRRSAQRGKDEQKQGWDNTGELPQKYVARRATQNPAGNTPHEVANVR